MDLESMGDLLEYAFNFFYIFGICLGIFFSCTPINIGHACNLYSAVDSGYVSSWLFAPPYWRGFFHINLCVYFISYHTTNKYFLVCT
jgi:hypothetical protein